MGMNGYQETVYHLLETNHGIASYMTVQEIIRTTHTALKLDLQ